MGRAGGIMESRASKSVVPLRVPSLEVTSQPLYQDMLVEVSIMLSPCHPEMGTKATAAGLYPTYHLNKKKIVKLRVEILSKISTGKTRRKSREMFTLQIDL